MIRYKLLCYLILSLITGYFIGAVPSQYFATVDRIVGDYAVVEVQFPQTLVFQNIPLSDLPSVSEGDHIIVKY